MEIIKRQFNNADTNALGEKAMAIINKCYDYWNYGNGMEHMNFERVINGEKFEYNGSIFVSKEDEYCGKRDAKDYISVFLSKAGKNKRSVIDLIYNKGKVLSFNVKNFDKTKIASEIIYGDLKSGELQHINGYGYEKTCEYVVMQELCSLGEAFDFANSKKYEKLAFGTKGKKREQSPTHTVLST
jgi:hypothetical protein